MREKRKRALRVLVVGNSNNEYVPGGSIFTDCVVNNYRRTSSSGVRGSATWLHWKHGKWISLYYGGGIGARWDYQSARVLEEYDGCIDGQISLNDQGSTSNTLGIGPTSLLGVRFKFGKRFSLMADLVPLSFTATISNSTFTYTDFESQDGTVIVDVNSSNSTAGLETFVNFLSTPRIWFAIHF